jgi:hypothetical protein
MECGQACGRKIARITDAAEFCDRCSMLVLIEPAAPSVEVTVSNDLSKIIDAVAAVIGPRALGQVNGPISEEDEAELKKFFDRFTFILDPVAQLEDLLRQAKVAPRFRGDTYDAVDRLDATLLSGDEFMATREIRQHFRYYLARWEKKLREYDEFDNAMDGEQM